MKWMKHMTATWNDEKISRLVATHGMAGYGLWWRVLEIVAARIEGESHPSVTYPVTTWSHLLSVRGSHVRQTLLKLEAANLITLEWPDGECRVTVPNLLSDFVYQQDRRVLSHEWAEIRSYIFQRDNYTCSYCGERGGRLECDHIIPVSRGGGNSEENLATACFSCNRSKHNKTVEEWRDSNRGNRNENVAPGLGGQE